MTWDPKQYRRFDEERALPFHHLVAAVHADGPARIADLGCGTGARTAFLLERWPNALIIGIDSSETMLEQAQTMTVQGRLEFHLGDVCTWQFPEPIDLMISNACFHWIDDHGALFDHLLPQLAEEGTLAFQVPANQAEPSHVLLRELCSHPRWRDRLDDLPTTGAHEPDWYLDELGRRGLRVTAWQTTYFHTLEGENPVLEWMRGTTLRPVRTQLADSEMDEFLTNYGSLLREAYPVHNESTVFPFRRTFVVAHHRSFT